MKFYHLLKLIFFSLLVFSCSSDENPLTDPISEEQPEPQSSEPEEPETEIYFTLNTFTNSAESGTVNLDRWVIIQDANGKLLDYSAYESGDKLEFKTSKDSLTPTINVTYLYFTTDADNRKNHEITTTTGIAKGYVATFGPYDSRETIAPKKEGEFQVNINNIPNPFNTAYPLKVELSSGRGRLGYSGSGSADASGIDLFSNIEKYESFDDYFLSVLDHNNILKYHYFENPSMEEYTADYQDDFSAVEKDISFVLPPHKSFYLNIAGFKEGQEFDANKGYWLHDSIFADLPTTPLRIGYADIFPKYRTIFSIQMEGYNYVIAHYGSPLDAVSVPDKPSFTATNTTINTFKFNVDIDYLSAKHSWNYVDNSDSSQYTRTNWTVSAEKGFDPTIGNLPAEIIEKYPMLNIDLMEYKSTRFDLSLEEAEFLSSHTLTVLNE